MASPNGENPPMASPNGEDPPMTTPNGEGPPNTKTKKRTRGLTAMKMVIRARSKNIKLHVEWNVKGQPKNKKGGSILVSYIGVIVRQMVPVTYDNWHDKALPGLKDIIWQDIISAFDVEEEHKTYILQSAGRSHRQFRTDAGKYVRDAEGNINLKPPKKYENIIREADWIAFVKKRTEDEKFLKLSEENRKRAKKCLYPYRKSRAGYRGVEEDILDRPETNPNVKMIDLEILWVDARKNKAGIIDNPNVQEAKDRCDALKQQSVSEGDIQEHGKKNILGKALNLPEYLGRLRGAGAGVCKTKYFPPQKRAKRADVVEFEEMKQMMKGLLQRVDELENKNQEKATERRHDLPCHGPSIKDSCTIATHNIPEGVTTCNLYLDSPMKRLVGIGKVHNLPGTMLHNTPLPPTNHVKVGIDIAIEGDAQLPVPLEDTYMIGEAIGTFVAWPIHLVVVDSKVPEESKEKDKEPQQTKVSVTSPAKGKKKSPLQVPKKSKVQVKQPHVRIKGKFELQVQEMSKKCKFCNLLKMHVKSLGDGVEMSISMPKDIFGFETEEFLSLNEVNEIVEHAWLSSSVICLYIRFLHQHLVKDKRPVMFLSPQKTSLMIQKMSNLGLMDEGNLTAHQKRDGQPQYIADTLGENKDKEFFLAPYNVGNHWVLIVINRIEEQIYYLDSLQGSEPSMYPDMKTIFTRGLQIYRAQNQSKATSNTIKWIRLKCPCQDNSIDCGYYVMYFMREIIEQCQNKRLSATLCRFQCLKYTEDMLTRLKEEWARYVLNII